jgi:hypothetical protein
MKAKATDDVDTVGEQKLRSGNKERGKRGEEVYEAGYPEGI